MKPKYANSNEWTINSRIKRHAVRLDANGSADLRASDRDSGVAPAGAHQNYMALNLGQPYVVFNDLPTLAHLREQFLDLYRSK